MPPHPLVKHYLAIARNAATPPAMFRGALAELGRVLMYEAVREWLQVVEGSVMTPFAETEVEFMDPSKPIKVKFHLTFQMKCVAGGCSGAQSWIGVV